jgi:hypothetical protein
MPAPSLDITIGDRGPASPQPGDVGAWFAAGLFDRGPTTTVTECLSLNAVKAAYGDVVTYSDMVREAEAYFREANGAGRMLVKRIVGAAASNGTLVLASSVSGTMMTVNAISPGSWSTELTLTIAGSGGTRTVTFKQAGATVFSTLFSTALDMQAALVATGLVTAPLGAGVWPPTAITETALSAGSDDRASIPTTEAGWRAELDVFDNEHRHETGTVSLPGVTTPAAHAALFAHAKASRRFAEADGIDTATAVSLTSPAATIRALGVTAGYGQVLAPWVKIPGPGTGTVTIPPSGAVAGRMAAADRENRAGPGQPAACGFGVFRWVKDVTQTYSKADRDTLADAGVTVIRNVRGRVQPFSSRTVADPALWPQYDSAAGMRVVLAVASECYSQLLKYLEAVIDGNGHLYGAIQKDLVGIGQSWYERDALFGATPAEAFAAIVGPGPTERALAANLVLRPSESVNTISLLITTIATSDVI